MSSSLMPPCFDCDIKLERRNVVKATNEEMDANPNYDFCKWKDGSGIVRLCDDCDQKIQNQGGAAMSLLRHDLSGSVHHLQEVQIRPYHRETSGREYYRRGGQRYPSPDR